MFNELGDANHRFLGLLPGNLQASFTPKKTLLTHDTRNLCFVNKRH